MENVEQIVKAMETEEEKVEEGQIEPSEKPKELGARPKDQNVEISTELKSRIKSAVSPSLSGSEPSAAIRTSTDVGSPPSYRRFSSPRPPRFTIERKMSAGILRTSETSGKKSAEPNSPAPSVDRLSVTFADVEDDEPEKDTENIESKEIPEQAAQELMSEELTEEAMEVFGEDVVATLGETTGEYTEGMLEIQRSKAMVSQDPSGRRRSSTRRRSSMSSSIFQGRARRRFSSSGGRTSSSGESLISSRSRSSAVSKGDLEAVKLHNEVIEQAK